MKQLNRWCDEVLKKSKARAAVLILLNGHGKHGMAISVKEDFSVARGQYFTKRLPKLLRQIAMRIAKGIRWSPAPSKVKKRR